MDDAALLIRALAELLSAVAWPLVALAIVYLFRGEVPLLTGRLKNIRLRLGDREVVAELDQLKASVAQLDQATRQLPAGDSAPVTGPAEIVREAATPAVPTDHFEVFEAIEQGTPPELIVIGLAAEIEREARSLLATFADESNWRANPIKSMVRSLNLDAPLRKAADEFSAVRNRVVHGRRTSPDLVLRALDLGITILRAIRMIPRAIRIVVHGDLPIFRDRECTQPHEGHGVMIETTEPDGRSTLAVYPTTRRFEPGDQVTWEWNMERIWEEAWYRDPVSDEPTYAWTSAAEFAGRSPDEL